MTASTLLLGTSPRARVDAPAGATLWASIGTVTGGVYDPGERRAPGYAIVVASDGSHAGAAVVTLIGHGTLPTHTSPGAQVTVVIAGARFGPIVADAKGDAAVPIDVPPEVRDARVIAVDHDGMRTERTVTLPASRTARGITIAPETLRAGERATVTVFAVGERGWRDAAAAPPEISVEGPLAMGGAPRAVAPGRWEVGVTAADGGGEARITARLDGEPLAPARLRVTGGAPATTLAAAARVGVASTPFQAAVAGELALRHGRLALAAELGYARGDDFNQVTLDVAGRFRLPVAPRVAVDLQAGAGVGFAESDASPILFAGAALAAGLDYGELVADARWADVRYVGLSGNGLGLVVTVGFRADLGGL